MSAYPVNGRLPPKQQTVLDFILKETADGGPFPTPEAIAAYMGWKHAQSASDCLYKLRWRGKIRIRKAGPGAHEWELAENSPLRGRAAAGEHPVDATREHNSKDSSNPMPVKIMEEA